MMQLFHTKDRHEFKPLLVEIEDTEAEIERLQTELFGLQDALPEEVPPIPVVPAGRR